jgi:hypothetical protein
MASLTSGKTTDEGELIRECIQKISQVVIGSRIPEHAFTSVTMTASAWSLSSSPPSQSSATASVRSNSWFSTVIPEYMDLRKEVSAQINGFPRSSSEFSVEVTVSNGTHSCVLERWSVTCAPPASLSASKYMLRRPTELNLGAIYRKMVVLVRSVYSIQLLLPGRKLFAALKVSNRPPFQVTYRVGRTQTLSSVFDVSPAKHDFGSIVTNHGDLHVSLAYRPSLPFPVETPEQVSRVMVSEPIKVIADRFDSFLPPSIAIPIRAPAAEPSGVDTKTVAVPVPATPPVVALPGPLAPVVALPGPLAPVFASNRSLAFAPSANHLLPIAGGEFSPSSPFSVHSGESTLKGFSPPVDTPNDGAFVGTWGAVSQSKVDNDAAVGAFLAHITAAQEDGLHMFRRVPLVQTLKALEQLERDFAPEPPFD